VSVELDAGFNYIYGENGSGKTALLEAIYLLARGRSFRAGRISGLINRDEDALAVRARLDRQDASPMTVAIKRARNGDASMRVDDRPEARISQLARHLPVQLLLPGVSELVFAGPAVRRSYLDWGLFHVEQSYLDSSRHYRRALGQRNAWLKTVSSGSIEQDPWCEQLLQYGCVVGALRSQYLQELAPCVTEVLSSLEPGLELGIEYREGGYGIDREVAKKKMSDSFARDVKFGTTHCGPHRADIRLTVGEHLALEDASRGQAKLIASAAVLGQALHLQRALGLPTVILIDDFGAELDDLHWRKYVDVLAAMDCQVIATSTYEPSGELLPDGVRARVFHVKQGVYHTVSADPITK
jgi:DNA replication and repair protein RecF